MPPVDPEGLCGRRKLISLLRRQGLQVAGRTVARAMKTLGHVGIARAKRLGTTIPANDCVRAGDLLERDFTADPPALTRVTEFTNVRCWVG